MIRSTHWLSMPLAAAAIVALAGSVALAADSGAAALKDGRVHGFSGCLAQEPSGTRYFDLGNAKSDDGRTLGTVRLTSSVWGIQPKQSIGREVHVNGMYRGRVADDPAGGHIAVKDAAVVATKCS